MGAPGQKLPSINPLILASADVRQTKLRTLPRGTSHADVPTREFSGRFQVIPLPSRAHGFRGKAVRQAVP